MHFLILKMKRDKVKVCCNTKAITITLSESFGQIPELKKRLFYTQALIITDQSS